jgi:hypothetical protein
MATENIAHWLASRKYSSFDFSMQVREMRALFEDTCAVHLNLRWTTALSSSPQQYFAGRFLRPLSLIVLPSLAGATLLFFASLQHIR